MPHESEIRHFTVTEGVPNGEGDLTRSAEDLAWFHRHAEQIAEVLGMTALNACVVTTESDGFGFRPSLSSEETYDFRGVSADGTIEPSELLKQL